MLSDAEHYRNHHNMQLRDTKLLMESLVGKMDWSDQENDLVMDIGCGPGSSTRNIFLPAFPRVRKWIAVDILEDMIEYAEKNNAHEKIEYHVANIQDRNTILKWSQQISKVISIYCFNWLDNQKAGFENIYHMLKPGGEAAVHFALSTQFWDSYHLHYNNPKYKKYLENKRSYIPESHFKKHDATFYRNILESIGFDVIICEDTKRTFIYQTDEDCKNSCYSRSALANYIPDELKHEFKEDNFQGFLKYNGRNSEGKAVLYYTTLTLLIQKPRA